MWGVVGSAYEPQNLLHGVVADGAAERHCEGITYGVVATVPEQLAVGLPVDSGVQEAPGTPC